MNTITRFSIVAALIHLALILLVAIIYISGHRDGPMLWLVFRGIDYPIAPYLMDSILWDQIPKDFSLFGEGGNKYNHGANFWRPFIIFGTSGTLWWAAIGALAGIAYKAISVIGKHNEA